MKTKKILSSVVLAATMLLNFSGTVFAVTVTETAISNSALNVSYVLDSVVSSAGVEHVVFTQSDGTNTYLRYRNSGTGTTTELDNTTAQVSYFASVALDSSGNQGIAWREWDQTGNTSALYFQRYTGAGWGGVRTVATGLQNVSAVPALGYYRDGDDADRASIITCGVSDSVFVAEYKATNTGAIPPFADPITVSSSSSHACSAVDMVIGSTDVLDIVTAPNSGSTASYAFKQTSGSWGEASTVFTGVDVQNYSNVFLDVSSTGQLVAVITDDAAADGTDNILYNEVNGGNWGTQETVVSGVRLNQDKIDMAIDTSTGNDTPFVFYFDNTNNQLEYAYNGDTWTTGVVDEGFTSSTMGGDYFNSVVADDYASGSKMIVYAGLFLTGNDELNKYELTDLPSGGGDSGGGVPEFSTYVYTMTALMLFGMVYWKSEGGRLQGV